jgi:sialate O-acetylesterase
MLSSHMVLQAAPAQSAVFGNVGSQDPSAAVSVTLSSSTGEQIKVSAVISSGRWKAVLPPQPSVSTVTWNITATLTCTGGACSGSAQLSDVIFGDVFFCFGQSNLWLQLRYTYARNSTKAAIATGAYDNIRLMSGDSQVNGITPTTIPIHPWRRIRDALSIPSENTDSLDQFSAMCLHFAEAVTDAFTAKGAQPPVIGLLGMAIGGSMIEEWITNDVAAACYGADPNANGAALNHLLWDNIIVPSLDMTLKAFLYYQGENSAGNLHGNSAENAGYACLMPGLVRSFREAWSATPGTTDPNAPFGIVTLSTADSEGAADIASFRFAQAASYFAVPNPALPNSFLAHAYDLADVWGDDCGDQPQTKKCQNCDTTDPDYNCLQQFYMGPSIHPRLKKPVGQRLAAAGLPLIYPEAGFAGPITGPTLSGCSLASDSLILHINATLLAGAPLIVRSYNMSDPRRSGLSVLINEKPAAGSGNWMPLTFTLGSDGVSLVVDLSALNGVIPTAVKYAWGPSDGAPNSGDVVCCDAASTLDECKPGMCPLSVSLDRAPFGGLPANPFIAQIINGSCMCPWPQECNA